MTPTPRFLLALFLSSTAAASAAAAPDFKAFADKQGCDAIPYDTLRDDCVAKQKEVTAECNKEMSCKPPPPQLAALLASIKVNRTQYAQLIKQRAETMDRKSAAGSKPHNDGEVAQLEKAIDLIDARFVKLAADLDKLEDAVTKLLAERVDNARSCLRVHAELEDVFDEVAAKLATEPSDLFPDEEKMFPSLRKAIDDAQPAKELPAQLQACIAASQNPQAYILKGPVPKTDCIGAGEYKGKLWFGEPLHKRRAWCTFQEKDRLTYPDPTDEMSSVWSAQYDQLFANSRHGSVFERAALESFGYTKNHALMEKPAAAGKTCADGLDGNFIPDAVKGSSSPTLVWGDDYDFVEVKGWQDMSFTGNLKKMIQYVTACEHSSLTVIFRSDYVPTKSATSLSSELATKLKALEDAGRAHVVFFP